MTKNQKKVSSLILVILLSVTGVFYKLFQSDDSEKSKIESLAQNHNDNWLGEGFYGLKDLKSVRAKNYLISTADERASKVGAEILDKGGNAIDAAIAAQMVLNVIEPQSSGIGGGAFIVYYDAKTKQASYFNGRETAPENVDPKMFLDHNGKPREFSDVVQGGMSVGTPGLLKALKEAHQTHGKLSWNQLFEPAIKIARNGFPMDNKILSIINKLPYLKNSGEFTKLYLQENGKPKELGTNIKNPAIADSFEIIAKEGIEPFYNGKIADDIIETVSKSAINPGRLQKSDLQQYQIRQGNLLCGTYRFKYKICSMPIPSSGGVTILQILGILENFDLSPMEPISYNSIHLIAEASKLAYADRNYYLGDTLTVPVRKLLDHEYLKSRSKLISNIKIIKDPLPGNFNVKLVSKNINPRLNERPSTTHLSIIDKEGNAISMTSSIEYMFGSTLMVDGFMLNNQMTDFSFIPEINGKPVANRIEPLKQPRSSMSPTFVFDDKDNLIMIIGSPGGPRIIQFVVKTILNYLDWGMDIQSAISSPNFIALNGVLELEAGTSIEKFANDLTKIGHKVQVVPITSGLNGITINEGIITGGADPRRLGAAIGK